MRSEAVGEGELGMLLVGNVVVNRVVAACDVFNNLRTIEDVLFQSRAFTGAYTPLFSGAATGKEKELALRNIKGFRAEPANFALWFQNPGENNDCNTSFYGELAGRFKNHCFYVAYSDVDCHI